MSDAHPAYTFGEFTLDLRRGALLRAGVEVKLRPKPFEVLRVLVERHGELVSKDDLLSAVWGRTIVTEGAVTQCLIDIRRALGDDEQQIVRTVPRRGYVFDLPVTVVGAPAVAPRSVRPWVLAAAAAGVVLGAIALAYLERERVQTPAAGTAVSAAHRSIAVLPFADLSEAQDQQFLSDGLTEEILDRLARSQHLKVIARTSSFQFRNRPLDVPEIARRLDVTHVLEGSIRRSGDRVRVTVQLIDAPTNLHVWSHVYERDVGDLFALQDEIADSVAATLQTRLAPDESADRAPRSAAAYESHLQGRFFFARRGEGDLERAISHFERAVELDPGFARGWADLAGAYNAAAGADYSSPWKAKQKVAAQRAVAADPNLVVGHVRLAQYYFDVGDGLAAQEQFRIASGLDPDDKHLATLAVGGRPAWSLRVSDEELEESRRAAARDPLSPISRFLYGINLFAAGRLDEALAEFRTILDLNPEMAWDQRLEITRVLVAKGDHDAAYREALNLPEGLPRAYGLALLVDSPAHRAEADAAFAALATARSDEHTHYVRMAELSVLRGRRDEAFAWLERGQARIPTDANRNSRLWWFQAEMHVAPFLGPLHADPRWAALMAVPDWATTPEPQETKTSAAGATTGSSQ